jgi:Fe-S-cluster containining protein
MQIVLDDQKIKRLPSRAVKTWRSENAMISPTEVKTRGRKLSEDNFKFRTFLRNHADEDELDAQFLQLHKEMFKGYDCCKCTNCCKAFEIPINTDEVETISEFLGITDSDFISDYLIDNETSDPDEGQYLLKKERQCVFLENDGRCQIQEVKPTVCKMFPYTDQPERAWSLLSTLSSAKVCPIVFEIIESLKEIYGFRNNY